VFFFLKKHLNVYFLTNTNLGSGSGGLIGKTTCIGSVCQSDVAVLTPAGSPGIPDIPVRSSGGSVIANNLYAVIQ